MLIHRANLCINRSGAMAPASPAMISLSSDGLMDINRSGAMPRFTGKGGGVVPFCHAVHQPLRRDGSCFTCSRAIPQMTSVHASTAQARWLLLHPYGGTSWDDYDTHGINRSDAMALVSPVSAKKPSRNTDCINCSDAIAPVSPVLRRVKEWALGRINRSGAMAPVSPKFKEGFSPALVSASTAQAR